MLYHRCEPFLPQCIGGCALAGINARLRFFRYYQGAVYRPHIDGAWPGAGLNKEGELIDDFFGDRTSKLTFLIYLNSGFSGGATRFFLPSSLNVINKTLRLCSLHMPIHLFRTNLYSSLHMLIHLFHTTLYIFYELTKWIPYVCINTSQLLFTSPFCLLVSFIPLLRHHELTC